MSGPARITIEIEPTRQPGRWITRTRVEERRSGRSREGRDASAAEGLRRWREDADATGRTRERTAVETMFVQVPEPREPTVVPAAYEPPTDCTCVDGWCDTDHEND